jgi:hypothetical protein
MWQSKGDAGGVVPSLVQETKEPEAAPVKKLGHNGSFSSPVLLFSCSSPEFVHGVVEVTT